MTADHSRNRFWLQWCLGIIVLCCALQLSAHPLAPGLMRVQQLDDGSVQLLWKTPRQTPAGLRLRPDMPAVCSALDKGEQHTRGTALLYQWRLDCGATLVGQRWGVTGLQAGLPGVLLQIQLADGRHLHRMLDAREPGYVIPARQGSAAVFVDYMLLGIDHLATGIDHLLFVLILTLLVGWGSRLVWTITLFTLGHSITLALAVLGYVDFPGELVEIAIAFSIAIAAAVLVKSARGGDYRQSWLMAGSFGLLHGLGFAGALTSAGLPSEAIPLALAAFNIGIEIGQLAVVALVLAAIRLLHAAQFPALRRALGYGSGVFAAYWFWARLDEVINLGQWLTGG